MTVQELKTFLANYEDNQNVILKSSVGIEWEVLPRDFEVLKKFEKKPNIYIGVK